MPPMPPISGIAGADDLSSGLSVIIASVVVSKAATETASLVPFYNFSWINDTGFYQVTEFTGLSIKSIGVIFTL